jgi:transcription elongation factor Elf1
MDNTQKLVRIAFDCAKCGNNIQLNWDIYTGYYEGHALCMSCRPAEKAQILSEEELKVIEDIYSLQYDAIAKQKPGLVKVFTSHRTLNSRNHNLVLENDELMAENMLRQKYESFLKSVIRSGECLEDECDFEWFKQRMGSISNVAEVFK